MAKLHVIYDPLGTLVCSLPPESLNKTGTKIAVLSIADDLEGTDIYNIARKLAEMLMEQIR